MLSTRQLTLDYGPTTRFGKGAIAELPGAITRLGSKRTLLVTDPGIRASGLLDGIFSMLISAGIEARAFADVRANPTTDTLDAGAQVAREWAGVVVVAVGGGSVLDASKGIALMATNSGPAEAFDYRNDQAHPGAPLIAVPTTAGTGAETNSFGVIEDPGTRRKFYVGHPSVLPSAVILDPELTRTLPPGPTAATGMDVLVHALESLSSPANNPYAEGLNLQVISMVSRFLPRAWANGSDMEARAQMLLAAHMAGLAFATTGLGVGHALAHALGARIGAIHGAALAAVLPHVLRFNLPLRADVYARAAWALGIYHPGRDDLANAEAAIERVQELAYSLELPASLREQGLAEHAIPAAAADALADEVILNSPRVPSQGELEDLLRAAL